MRSLRAAAALVVLGVLASRLGLGMAHASRGTEVAPSFEARDATGALVEVGPRPMAQGAPTPKDFTELEAWVADPNGPTEIVLGPRTYTGDLTVKRPLRLRGSTHSVLEGSRHGTVLSVEADGVRVENLRVRGSGRKHTTEDAAVRLQGKGIVVERIAVDDSLFGITLQRCESCVVRGVHVRGRDDDPELRGDGVKLWESHDSQVIASVVEDSRDVVVWYSRRVHLEGNVIRRSRYGTHFMYAHDGVVKNERLLQNVVGIFAMYSSRLDLEGNVLAGARGAAGVGLGFKECDGATVRGNRLLANSTGLYLDRSPRSAATPLVVVGNVFGLNDVAMRFLGIQEGVRVASNDLEGNGRLVQIEGGGDAMRVNFENNYLSEYAGYDLDRDGVGDVAFEKKQLGSDLTATHPSARLLEGTVALAIIDGVAMAMPVLATKRLFTDPRPSMRPHAEEIEP
jgi:nitrous oxidase accessory protein